MLEGKVAVISGGARGMGAAHARVFLSHGARVVIGDVREAEGKTVAKELGEGARFCALDVTDEDAWERIMDEAIHAFGRVDVLVNNAAICPVQPLTSTPPALYRQVVEVNQIGVFLGIRAAIEPMSASGGGAIINIASIDGLRGVPNLIAYSSSKYAVRGIARTAALELAPRKIRVNAIHPGSVQTPMFQEAGESLMQAAGMADGTVEQLVSILENMTPSGRISQPEEVAQVSAFLASDAGSYFNGAELVFDGGLTAGAAGA